MEGIRRSNVKEREKERGEREAGGRWGEEEKEGGGSLATFRFALIALRPLGLRRNHACANASLSTPSGSFLEMHNAKRSCSGLHMTVNLAHSWDVWPGAQCMCVCISTDEPRAYYPHTQRNKVHGAWLDRIIKFLLLYHFVNQ